MRWKMLLGMPTLRVLLAEAGGFPRAEPKYPLAAATIMTNTEPVARIVKFMGLLSVKTTQGGPSLVTSSDPMLLK
jgi:hypothetical protein